MLKRIILRSVMLGMFVLSAMVLPACTMTNAEPQSFTGASGPTHERNAEGIDSQVGDN